MRESTRNLRPTGTRKGSYLSVSILLLFVFILCAAHYNNTSMVSVANTFLFLAGASTVASISLVEMLITNQISRRPSAALTMQAYLEESESRITQLIFSLKTSSDRNWLGDRSQDNAKNYAPSKSGEVRIFMIRDLSEVNIIPQLLDEGKTVVLNFAQFGLVKPEEFLDRFREQYSPEKYQLTTVEAGIYVLTSPQTLIEPVKTNYPRETSSRFLDQGTMGPVLLSSSDIRHAEREADVDHEVNELPG